MYHVAMWVDWKMCPSDGSERDPVHAVCTAHPYSVFTCQSVIAWATLRRLWCITKPRSMHTRADVSALTVPTSQPQSRVCFCSLNKLMSSDSDTSRHRIRSSYSAPGTPFQVTYDKVQYRMMGMIGCICCLQSQSPVHW